MSLRPITLKTDKSITPVSDDTRVLRSTEKGLVLDVTILNEDDSPYDLTGKNLSFSEIKESQRVVADDGSGDASGIFKIIDAAKGHFSYAMTHQCYTASGTCFFQIKQGNDIVDTTQDFYFKVKVDPTVKPINDSYVSSMIAMEDHLLGATKQTQAKIDQLNATSTDAQNRAKEVLDKLNNDFADYTKKYNDLHSNWENQSKAIQKSADDQLASIKTTDKVALDAAIKSINDQRDQALDKLNGDTSAKLSALQSDYNSWKTKTVKDFDDTVKPIKDSISQNNENLTKVSKQVNDTITSMQNLKKQFDAVDFSKFVKPSDLANYYTKKEVDDKLATAGAVKTVDGINPDAKGNVATDHYTKKDTDTKLGTKVTFKKCSSPQEAHDVSTKPGPDGSLVIGYYDMNDEPTTAVVGDKKVTIETLYDSLNSLSSQVSGLSSLQSIVNGKANSADVVLKTDFDNTVNQLKASIATAGQVKTVNGAKPDSAGNINISMSNYATKDDIKDMVKSRVISEADYNNIQNKNDGFLYYVTE